MRIGLSPLIIELNHALKVWQAAIMHVRCGLGNLAQGRRLESAPVFGDACYTTAAFVGKTTSIPTHTEIVKDSVTKVVALVAISAMGFALKQFHPFRSLLGHGLRVPCCIAVVV